MKKKKKYLLYRLNYLDLYWYYVGMYDTKEEAIENAHDFVYRIETLDGELVEERRL